jgi:hypothetical protein
MMHTKIVEERIHTDTSRHPDAIDIGKAGARVHITFNALDLVDARERVDNAMTIRDYAINELIIRELKAAEAKAAKK